MLCPLLDQATRARRLWPVPATFAWDRRECHRRYAEIWPCLAWAKAYRRGWRCVRVTLELDPRCAR
jgi:hypothetical protein